MNHLESLVAEWLNYNGYFTRSAVRVGRRPKGGWDGELDVVGFHPGRRHFVHVECSNDALTWSQREESFRRKFKTGGVHAAELFCGMELPPDLDQVAILGYATAVERHRKLGGGRLVTSQELVAEIMNALPANLWKAAVPESFPLLRTLQCSIMAGASVSVPNARLIHWLGDPMRNVLSLAN